MTGQRRMGITLRTALLSWLVSAATLGVFVFVILPEQKQTFLENLDSKAHGVGVSVREVMSGAINEDYSAVVDHCRELLAGDPAIDYVVVTKNDGFSLVHERSGWRMETNMPAEWRPARRMASSGISVVPYFNKQVFRSAQPFDYSGIEWGWIHVGLSLDSYHASVRNLNGRTAFLAVLCIIVSFMASVVYARRLVGPILNLRHAVFKIAGGDLTARAVVQSTDEVGNLAQAFNRMAEGLSQRDKILQSVRFAAEKFLTSADWRKIIAEVLGEIGAAAQASRLGIFQNLPGAEGEVVVSRIFEWTAPGLTLRSDHVPLEKISWHRCGLGALAERMANGEIISARFSDLPSATRRFVQPYGTMAFLAAPIMVDGVWWGVLVLSDREDGRTWTGAETASCRAVADMLGAAIARQRTQTALLEAKEKAEAASHAKSQFLANMSHEIRTPITGVMGMLHLLRRTQTDQKQTRYVNQALDSADTLLAVIGDVLDFSKIEAGRLELAENDFSLHEVVDSAVHLFAGRAEQKGLELVGRLDSELADEYRGDANRLRQILVNLVGNALKFTDRGEIVLSCRLEHTYPEGTVVRFEVRDTGCGIAAEHQALIFEAFSQADDSMSRAHGGTGLGLAISRQLCGLMGGELGVESELGKGSTFWFTVRLKPVAIPAPITTRRLRDLRHLPVLVVDDSAVMREVVCDLIESWQGEPLGVSDAAAAFAQLQSAAAQGRPYAVAILDWRMPGEDGLSLAERIQAAPDLRGTGLVLLTSFAQALREEEVRNFAATISKPVRCSDLYDAVVNAANAHRQRDEGRAAGGAADGKPSTRNAAPATSSEPTLLLAEDNEINREVVTEMLSHLGYRWRCVVNGREALAAVQGGGVALVLMDCQMPEMDGYQASRAIREWEEGGAGPVKSPGSAGRIPIIALTAHAMSGDRERCLAAGMDDYLTKPIDPDLLQTMLAKWLAGGGRRTAGEGAAVTVRPATTDPAGSVDRAALLCRCMGKAGLADRLVVKLAEQAAEDERELVAALAVGDAERLLAAAHRLKGAAANVAANPLRQVAFQIEVAARGRRLAEVPELMAELRVQLQRLTQFAAGLGSVSQSAIRYSQTIS